MLETAKWWADLRSGTGNIEDRHPEPRVVPQSDEAESILIETRLQAEAEYAKAEAAGDEAGTAVWGRVSEHARKLALIYAVSECHDDPKIRKAAVKWASRFVMHQARRMLFMAQSYVADNLFDAECLKFLQKLRSAPRRELAHSVLLKRMKIKAKDFEALVATLKERGDILERTQPGAGRTGRFYRLAEGPRHSRAGDG